MCISSPVRSLQAVQPGRQLLNVSYAALVAAVVGYVLVIFDVVLLCMKPKKEPLILPLAALASWLLLNLALTMAGSYLFREKAANEPIHALLIKLKLRASLVQVAICLASLATTLAYTLNNPFRGNKRPSKELIIDHTTGEVRVQPIVIPQRERTFRLLSMILVCVVFVHVLAALVITILLARYSTKACDSLNGNESQKLSATEVSSTDVSREQLSRISKDVDMAGAGGREVDSDNTASLLRQTVTIESPYPANPNIV